MKIVFLDMDGVLNGSDLGIPNEREYNIGDDRWWAMMVNPLLVSLLNKILEASNAKVVISSSWRYHANPEQMQRILNLKGFKGNVIGRTPLSTELPTGLRDGLRGTEIEFWLVKNKHLDIKSFVILDDMGPHRFGNMTSFLVQTNSYTGIRVSDVNSAIDILHDSNLHPGLKG